MSKGNTHENELLLLTFNASSIGGFASASGITSLYISLHTADPGEGGDQTTNEANYGSYARVAVGRTNSGFTVAASSVTNTAAVTFPAATSGSNTITHFAIGTASSGAGKILYKGAVGASLAVSAGITPEFGAGTMTITED